MMYDKNQIQLSGKIVLIESFNTKKGLPALNIHVESVNKYIESLPCVAYGSLAELINEKLTVGANIIIFGRMMVITTKEAKTVTSRIIIEKIGIELICPEGDSQKNGDK